MYKFDYFKLPSFQVVSKANKLLQEKETSDKFKLILADAKNRVLKMVSTFGSKIASSLFLPDFTLSLLP